MSDPVTAHGWTAHPAHPGWTFIHGNGTRVMSFASPHHTVTVVARDDLARCIEDAATLAQARELAAALHRGENIFTGQVDDIHRLLTLLTGDGTP